MSEQFRLYTTLEGDRWDLISYNFYGTVEKMDLLIASNPYVPLTPTLEGAVEIKIPVLESLQTMALQDLPPWKQ